MARRHLKQTKIVTLLQSTKLWHYCAIIMTLHIWLTHYWTAEECRFGNREPGLRECKTSRRGWGTKNADLAKGAEGGERMLI